MDWATAMSVIQARSGDGFKGALNPLLACMPIAPFQLVPFFSGWDYQAVRLVRLVSKNKNTCVPAHDAVHRTGFHI